MDIRQIKLRVERLEENLALLEQDPRHHFLIKKVSAAEILELQNLNYYPPRQGPGLPRVYLFDITSNIGNS